MGASEGWRARGELEIALPGASGANRIGRREMVFAERHHGTRLRASSALGVLRDKANLVADGELVEPIIGDAVAVEVELGAIGGQDEAAILLGEQVRDPTVVGYRMQLYIAALFANVIFEQPAHGIERIANGDMHILMRMMGRRIAADDDLAARDAEVYEHMEQIALLTARVPAFNDDAARDDPIEEALELLDPSADAGRDRLRAVHVTKSDLKRDLH